MAKHAELFKDGDKDVEIMRAATQVSVERASSALNIGPTEGKSSLGAETLNS